MKIYVLIFIIIVIVLLSIGASSGKSNTASTNTLQDQRRQIGGSKNSKYTILAVGVVAIATVVFIVSRIKIHFQMS